MKFGICSSSENVQQIKDAGFDYIELNLTKLCKLSDDDFLAIDITAPTSNCFFPADIALVGENVDYDKIKQYTDFALKRANALGVDVAVLGSGKSRSIPDGFDKNTATCQFKKVIEICAEIAKKYDIKIAIEPLNPKETNFINTVAEAAKFCDELALVNVGIVADFYHMHMSGERMDGFENAGRHIIHLHIAKPDASRLAPSIEDINTLKTWAESIKKIGYVSRMSLECRGELLDKINNMNEIKYIFE